MFEYIAGRLLALPAFDSAGLVEPVATWLSCCARQDRLRVASTTRECMPATIVGWGKALPEHVRTNAELESLVDTTDEWIVSRTGIRERRIASDGETTFTLGRDAAVRALAQAGIAAADVDLVIVATLTPEMPMPSTASLIQDAIGARSAGAFDVNAACAGFTYGLEIARAFIDSQAARTVLLVGAETISRVVDWTDRSTCVLFGDGAGAIVLRASDHGGVRGTALGSDGSGAKLLQIAAGGSRRPASVETVRDRLHTLTMNGREVYKFAVKATARSAAAAMARAGWRPTELDLFIPHQANVRIIDAAARELQLSADRVFVNADIYGNTSSASIPIALCEAIEQGRVSPGDRLVLVGFGAGLSWAAVAVEWTAEGPKLDGAGSVVSTAATSAGRAP